MYVLLYKATPRSKWRACEETFSRRSVAEQFASGFRIGHYKTIVRYVDMG